MLRGGGIRVFGSAETNQIYKSKISQVLPEPRASRIRYRWRHLLANGLNQTTILSRRLFLARANKRHEERPLDTNTSTHATTPSKQPVTNTCVETPVNTRSHPHNHPPQHACISAREIHHSSQTTGRLAHSFARTHTYSPTHTAKRLLRSRARRRSRNVLKCDPSRTPAPLSPTVATAACCQHRALATVARNNPPERSGGRGPTSTDKSTRKSFLMYILQRRRSFDDRGLLEYGCMR